MPRRNRRAAPRSRSPRTPAVMTPAQLRSLRLFAADHLAGHALAYDAAEAGDTVVSGSEHPETGIRFLSVGLRLDERAMRLSEGVYASDSGVTVGS
jgi:hypothetical protein